MRHCLKLLFFVLPLSFLLNTGCGGGTTRDTTGTTENAPTSATGSSGSDPSVGAAANVSTKGDGSVTVPANADPNAALALQIIGGSGLEFQNATSGTVFTPSLVPGSTHTLGIEVDADIFVPAGLTTNPILTFNSTTALFNPQIARIGFQTQNFPPTSLAVASTTTTMTIPLTVGADNHIDTSAFQTFTAIGSPTGAPSSSLVLLQDTTVSVTGVPSGITLTGDVPIISLLDPVTPAVATPEPGSILVFSAVLASLGIYARRGRGSQPATAKAG